MNKQIARLSALGRCAVAGLLVAALVAGCSTSPKDELAGQAAEKLYRDAQEEASSGAYERAIRALERARER